MVKLKLKKSRRAQSQFVFLVIITGLSVSLIASIFFVFSEIRERNEDFSTDNELDLLGEEIVSSIVQVYSVGENMHYNGNESILLYSTNVIIPSKYSRYRINASNDKVVITHKDKKKEIKIHNLNNTEVNGVSTGKTKISIGYYRNSTDRSILLS